MVDVWKSEQAIVYFMDVKTSVQCEVHICRSACRGGTAISTQHSGDRLDFTWNTHDPPGCPAAAALSEVLFRTE